MSDGVIIKRELLKDVLKDPSVSPIIKYILEKTPFASNNYVARLKGMVDDHDGGEEFVFPSKLLINGEVVDAYTGSTLYVSPEYRKYMLGLMLPEEMMSIPESGITYAAGCSKDARPVYRKYLKYTYFPLFRFVYIRKTRAVFDAKVSGFLSKVLAPITDVFLVLIHSLHGLANVFRYRKFEVNIINNETELVLIEDLIKRDKHKYQEFHNAEWFKWIKDIPSNNKFNKQELFAIKCSGKLVAFWMIKTRFTANINNYKNLVVGTITEWGTLDENLISERDICAIAIHHFPKYVDVIQTFSNDRHFVSRLPFLCKEKGESNVIVKILKGYDNNCEDYKDISKWRLRPAMADTMFF